MINRIVISESQYNRLFLNEQTKNPFSLLTKKGERDDGSQINLNENQKVDPPSLKNGEVGGGKGVVRNPDMTTGWLSHDGKKGKYAYLFGGEPFHISYFCPDYTPSGGYSGKLSLPNTEIEKFRDLILDNSMSKEEYETVGLRFNSKYSKMLSDGGGHEKDRLVSKILHFRNNYVKTGKFDRNSWSDEQRKGFEKMLTTLSRSVKNRDVMCPYVTLNDLGNQMYHEWVEPAINFIYEYRHEIIDVLSVAALFIPVPGLNVALSMALEGINGGLYLAEGDELSGFLSFIFMLVPGVGPLLRRMTQKSIVRVMKIMKYADGKGQRESASAAFGWLEKAITKLTPDEKILLDLTMSSSKVGQKEFANVTKKEFKDKVKDEFPEWFGNYKTVTLGFGKGSKFLRELLNPTMFEKLMYPTVMLATLYLNKSGFMEIAGDSVYKMLVSMGILNGDSISESEAINMLMEEWENRFTDIGEWEKIPPEERREILEGVITTFVEEMDTTVFILDKLPKNFSGRDEIILMDIDKKNKIKEKLKTLELPEELKGFESYNWVKDCSVNKKIQKNITLTPEIITHLEDEVHNYRRIRVNSLGSDYQYSSWDDYWFHKKDGSDVWVLVNDCSKNVKIESELDKKFDGMIDTNGELFDKFDDVINWEEIDFFN